jgi:hypothetical protein
MGDAIERLPYVLYVALPLLLFMAWIYLGLHILFARFVRDPQSPVLWFFGVVTGPLTRPVRAVLAAETPEPRVRLIAFASYVGLWLVTRIVLAQLMGPVPR